jgi:hypothetical protein
MAIVNMEKIANFNILKSLVSILVKEIATKAKNANSNMFRPKNRKFKNL